MQIVKYILGTFVIILGLVTFFNSLASLPEGIVAIRQGNMARSGAATGGLLFGPLIIWGGIALWRSGLRQARLSREADIAPADRVGSPDDGAE